MHPNHLNLKRFEMANNSPHHPQSRCEGAIHEATISQLILMNIYHFNVTSLVDECHHIAIK